MNNNKDININKSKPKVGFGAGHGSPMGMAKGGEKAKDFKNTMKRLSKYLAIYKSRLILVVLFAIGSTIFAILSPKILGNVTNQLVDDYIGMLAYDQFTQNLPSGMSIEPGTTGADLMNTLPEEMMIKIPEDRLETIKDLDLSSRPTIDYDSILYFILVLLTLFILSAIFSIIQGLITSDISQKVAYKFRKEILEKINKLPLKYFDKTTYGDVLSRITNDVDTIGQSLNQSMTQLIGSVITIIGILIMMLTINVTMTFVALLILPLSMVLIRFIIKKSQKFFKQQQQGLGKLDGNIEELYSGHNIVKIFNAEERSLDNFNIINDKLYKSAWKSQFLTGLMFPIMNVISNIGYAAVAVLGGYLAIDGKVKIGDIQAFIQYMQQFTRPITQTANISNVLQSTAAAAERIFEFLAEPEEQNLINSVEIQDIQGQVTFEHVKFGYDKNIPVIKDFSAKIQSGQRIAIVGPTGAGKTTIVNLLMRFYDIDSGKIMIDGIDINKMSRSYVRSLLGMVLQDTWLFNGTIRQNIAYGKSNTSNDEVIKAAKLAHADHFIQSLPKGYDMVLNEEVNNISEGEKQLITIARAMLANPPILILDEATSSVDTRTEVLIQKAMDNLMKNRTSFVIAHRLSTIKNADLILVIDNGNIVEQGNHIELLNKQGFYADLYNSQFEE